MNFQESINMFPCRQIIAVRIESLFGIYSHVVRLKESDGITILAGANGYGKTTILKLIKAFSDLNLNILAEVPYQRFSIWFNDFSQLTIDQKKDQMTVSRRRRSPAPRRESSLEEFIQNGHRLTFSLYGPDNNLIEPPYETNLILSVNEAVNQLDTVEIGQFASEWMRITGTDSFRNRMTGQIITRTDLLERYGYRISQRILENANSEELVLPEWLHLHAASVCVRLITTERLTRPMRYITDEDDEDILQRDEQLTLAKYSQIYKRIVRRALDEMALEAQKRDRSFPARLIERSSVREARSTKDLTNQFERIEKTRIRLAKMDILISEAQSFRLSPDTEQIVQTVLSVYAEDELEKLGVLEKVLRQAELFVKIINSRLHNKRIFLNREKGFIIYSNPGSEIIPLESLSSGEQHEIVLFFDLIFRMEIGCLVLIDEPELSLHVAWQLRFVDDLIKVAAISNTKFVLATHSPSIIDDKWDYVVELDGENK